MSELSDKLTKMLGTGFEVNETGQKTFPIAIMTPFIDALGDNLVIYVEANANQHEYRYNDGGYIYDDVMLTSNTQNIHKIPQAIDYFGSKEDHHDIVSPWLTIDKLTVPIEFYAHLQSVLDSIIILTN